MLQLLHVRNPDTDEAAYLRVIERKTAMLFAAATRLGALLAGADAATQQALHDYGLHLGYAFQIADDVLDYASDAATLGKNLGDDLAEGKTTLPLIHAMAHSDDGVARRAAPDRRSTATSTALAAVQAAIARCRQPGLQPRAGDGLRRRGRRHARRRCPTTPTWMRCAGWRGIRSAATTEPGPRRRARAGTRYRANRSRKKSAIIR